MKRFRTIILSLLLLLFCACSFSKPAPEQPEHYKAAVNEITKGNYWYKKGCYDQAIEHFYKAHELYSSFDDQDGVGKSFNNIGNIYKAKEDTASAALFFDEAVNTFVNSGDFKGAVQALSNKAAAYINAEMLSQADVTLTEAEKISQEKSITYPPAISNRGILLLRQKKTKEAETILNKAIANTPMENHFQYASVNYALGTLMAETNKHEKAVDYFLKALEADRKSDIVKGVAHDLLAIGSAHYSLMNYNAAADYLQRSLKTFTLLGDKKNAGRAMDLLNKSVESAGENKPDISITLHFIDQWSQGKMLTSPCD